MKISFHGGAQEVTGACHLLETSQTKILVDCGMFQGKDCCPEANFGKFEFIPEEIDKVFITHAHIDHIGRLPRLIQEGFKGKIHSTPATKDLARPLLEDALMLARRGITPEKEPSTDAENLYTEKDLETLFSLWEAIEYGQEMDFKNMKVKFLNSGHILGSSLVEIWAGGKHLLFTGDLGNIPSVLLPSPEKVKDIDFLIIESAYGERIHKEVEQRVFKLERAVEDVAARGGSLLIPAFATERTQDLLHLLNEMMLFKRIPDMPVFVDSPLAIKITEVFENYPSYYKEEIKDLFRKHPNLFKFKKLRFTESVAESKSINGVPPPKIIIAGSGMMTGGRILHHARKYLADPNSILLIVGYQSRHSLGRRLLEGENIVKIFGEEIMVRAETRLAEGFSAHADSEQLFSFVRESRDTLKRVFVVQGEKEEAEFFAQMVKDRLGIQADAPVLYQEFEIK